LLEKSILEAWAVTDDHIFRAEDRARKMTAIWTAENLYQVFTTLEVTQQLVHQLNILHETSNLPNEGDMPQLDIEQVSHQPRKPRIYPESESLIWLCQFQAILQTPAGEA
jgi:hypothetical protein